MLVAPAAGEGMTLQHLEEQTGAAAGGESLFACHAVARAHGATLHPPTLPDAHTAQGGVGKAVTISGKREVGTLARWMVISPEAQVFVGPVGSHHLAGVQLSLRIPNPFERAKRLDQF